MDLRGNAGGAEAIAQRIAGLFVDKPAVLALIETRKHVEAVKVQPMKPLYSGPLVLLTDGMTASSAELFTGGMQEMRRGEVIGERTSGLVLGSELRKLPTGAILLFPESDIETPSGKVIEGMGVAPDIEVKLTRADLLAGNDPVLAEAIKYIQTEPH